MLLLFLKLLLPPTSSVTASLVARRYGALLAGLVAGMPFIAGPILLVYAVTRGAAFAATASSGALLGLVSLTAFILAYARLSSRLAWRACLMSGWAAFIACTLVMTAAPSSPFLALGLVVFCLAAAPMAMPRSRAEVAASPLPRWDIPLRAGSTLMLVLILTAAAGWLGPQLSGLLASFPVLSSVLAPFAHVQRGRGAALQMLHGLLGGFGAFAVFSFTVAVLLRPLGIPGAFGLAYLGAVLWQGSVFWRRRAGVAAETLEASGLVP